MTVMTGFLLFILLVVAITAGLEVQHRHVKRLGPEAPKSPDRNLRKRATRTTRAPGG